MIPSFHGRWRPGDYQLPEGYAYVFEPEEAEDAEPADNGEEVLCHGVIIRIATA